MARWATTITPLAGSGNSCGSAGKPGVGDSHVANALLLEKCLPLMKDHYCVDEICYLLSVPHSAFWEMVSENPGQFQLYYVVANLWPVCGTNTASSRLVQHLQKGAAVAPNLLWGDRAAHRLRLTPAPHVHLAASPSSPRPCGRTDSSRADAPPATTPYRSRLLPALTASPSSDS